MEKSFLRVEACNMEVSQVEKRGMWARRMGTARVNRARYINWVAGATGTCKLQAEEARQVGRLLPRKSWFMASESGL